MIITDKVIYYEKEFYRQKIEIDYTLVSDVYLPNLVSTNDN